MDDHRTDIGVVTSANYIIGTYSKDREYFRFRLIPVKTVIHTTETTHGEVRATKYYSK